MKTTLKTIKLTAASTLLFISTHVSSIYAVEMGKESFSDQSGMVFACYDDVSNYTYLATIVDTGDKEATIVENRGAEGIIVYDKYVEHKRSETEIAFVAHNGETGQEILTIAIPYNNIGDAYLMDSGDSRSLDCVILKN